MATIKVDTDILKELEQDILASWSELILEKTETIIETFSYKTFMGEAAEYLQSNGIDITQEIQTEYAKILLDKFKQDIYSLIYYDFETNTVKIHTDLMSCEYGDYYHPAIKLVTGSLELILKDYI